MRILVIEDDEVLLDVLENSLTNQRYIVDVAEDGRFGLECALGTDYDLILTDVGLPLMDGVTLCQRLRKEGYTTPILLMTAKDAPEERIKGLDAGADDYLVKPLDLGELHARVRALLRRGEVKPHNILEVAGLKLDPVSCQVTYQEKPIKLTPKEYGILEIFLRNPSRVYSRGQIIDALWSFDDPPLEDSVKAHIKGLRQKLKKAGLVDWIENVYGLGYRLNPHLENNQAITNADKSSVEVEFSQAMAALWQKHQPLMQERMNLLQEAVEAIQSNNLNPGVQQAAEKAAHKLAGVLGMFKREGGTQIAREIESLLGQNPQLTPAQQQNFLLLVSQLEDLLGLDNNISVRTITPAELLLISSEPELGDRLQQLAPSIGKKWQQVENIEAAKNWLKTNSPHLIVLESEKQSQWQNDLAFIQKITTSNPKISVIVLTDTDELGKRITASTAGANGFLVKPLTPTMLSSAVNQQLQQISGQSTKVLIVDDDPIILDTVVTILEPWGMQVTSLVNPEEFWQTLQTTNPDLVILDIDMPKISGIELCQAVRTDPQWQGLPILFLTAHQEAKIIQQGFTAGADDYLTKPVVSAELITRINNRLERTRLLKTLSTKERITGLTNQYQASQELENLIQQQISFGFVLLEMTDLKQINLKYGHNYGNQALASWGKLLQTAFRADEITSYWGNGEFIIVLPNCDATTSKERLAEILATLRRQVFNSADGSRFQVNYRYSVVEYPKTANNLLNIYQSCVQALVE